MQHKLTTQQTKTARGHAVLSWFVNPQDPDNAFDTINAAYAAADAFLPTGEAINIRLAPNQNHALAAGVLNLTAARDLHIDGQGELTAFGGRTTLTGNIVMPAYVGTRLSCELKNLDLVGAVTQGSNWRFTYSHGCYQPTAAFTRTHGAAGCLTLLDDITFNTGQFDVVDTDNGQVAANAFTVMNSYINSMVDATTAISIRLNTVLTMRNVHWEVMAGPAGGTLIDLNTLSNRVQMFNVVIYVSQFGTAPLIFGNNTASQLFAENAGAVGLHNNGFAAATGAWSSQMQGKFSISQRAVSGPFQSLEWHDTRTNEILTWNGTYWVVGDLVRVETVLNVGGAAADHDLGWNVPTGFAVVKASVRLLKALTGAGGAVKAGFGTKAAGDPDKYALTAAITAGNPNQTLNPTYNNGSGDDLAITGCDAAGAALGTLAGSGASDVRTMVWMRPPVTLAS